MKYTLKNSKQLMQLQWSYLYYPEEINLVEQILEEFQIRGTINI